MQVRFIITLFFLFSFGYGAKAQNDVDTAVVVEQEIEEFRYIPNYKLKYARALKRIKRVYPLALHAAIVLDSMDAEIKQINKKRKQKRFAKKTHKDLKNDFKYLLKELYVSEGKMLAKLIARETGFSVYTIISKFKGEAEANLYYGIAKAFDQDLKVKYDAENEDYITERVIENIEAGIEPFNPSFEIVDKAHFKADRKAYKARIKENSKKRKQRKKIAKRKARQEKRAARKQKKELN